MRPLVPPHSAVRTRTCSLWFDRVVYTRFHDAAEVSGDDARENLAATFVLTGGTRAPVLVDLRPIRSQSADARAAFAGTDATRCTLAVAIVISSPLSRVIGNFFLGFNKPETPARLFTSVDEAERWLRTFLDATVDAR